ncbi:MAG: zinc metallopeptidase [Myxococcota bacterium]
MLGFGFDPLYLVLVAPAFALGLWAQWKVKSTFGRYAQEPTARGMSGADIAGAILRVNGIRDVSIEPADGFLSDHYDPRSRTLRLSRDVYLGRTVAAAGVAAHEVGHAIQHANGYLPLQLRSALVPALSVTNTLAMPTLMVGFLLAASGWALGTGVLWLGIALFSVLVVFQLVTLPVELDASRRALAAIEKGSLVTGPELVGARRVLTAAALTYVAAAVSSILQLLYFVIRAGAFSSRDDDR